MHVNAKKGSDGNTKIAQTQTNKLGIYLVEWELYSIKTTPVMKSHAKDECLNITEW
jgi:hypothetical protein